jgi:hypothetical protein
VLPGSRKDRPLDHVPVKERYLLSSKSEMEKKLLELKFNWNTIDRTPFGNKSLSDNTKQNYE